MDREGRLRCALLRAICAAGQARLVRRWSRRRVLCSARSVPGRQDHSRRFMRHSSGKRQCHGEGGRLATWMGVSVMALLLAGCYPETPVVPKPADIVGEWRSVQPEGNIDLVFNESGTYASSNWPANLFCDQATPSSSAGVDWEHRIHVSGTWKIANDGQGTIRRISTGTTCLGGGGSLQALRN